MYYFSIGRTVLGSKYYRHNHKKPRKRSTHTQIRKYVQYLYVVGQGFTHIIKADGDNTYQ